MKFSYVLFIVSLAWLNLGGLACAHDDFGPIESPPMPLSPAPGSLLLDTPTLFEFEPARGDVDWYEIHLNDRVIGRVDHDENHLSTTDFLSFGDHSWQVVAGNAFMRYPSVRARFTVQVDEGAPPESLRWHPTVALTLPMLEPAVVHDTHRKQVLIFSGLRSFRVHIGDPWFPRGSEITQLTGPVDDTDPILIRHAEGAAVYDLFRQRVLMFPPDSDAGVFELPLLPSTGRWQRLETSGPTPRARSEHALVHDTTRDRLILYGGEPTAGGLGNLWALPLNSPHVWERITPSEPPSVPVRRGALQIAYSPYVDSLLVAGGLGETGAENSIALYSLADNRWRSLGESAVSYFEHEVVMLTQSFGLIYGGWTDDGLAAQGALVDLNQERILPLSIDHLPTESPFGGNVVVTHLPRTLMLIGEGQGNHNVYTATWQPGE